MHDTVRMSSTRRRSNIVNGEEILSSEGSNPRAAAGRTRGDKRSNQIQLDAVQMLRQRHRRPHGSVGSTEDTTRKLASKPKKQCNRCGGGPHLCEKCPAKDIVCHRCGKIGHYRTYCFTRKVSTIQTTEYASQPPHSAKQ